MTSMFQSATLGFVLATQLLVSSVGLAKSTSEATNVPPTLTGRSATCDLGFMDEFYNELRGGVCLNGSLLERDCLKFNASEAIGMIPWVMGVPGRIAALLVGTSGIQAKDGYIEDETPQQTIGRNRLRQSGIQCDSAYNKYVTTQLDHQIHEGELERPAPDDEDDDDEEETPATRRRQTAAQRAEAERKREEAKKARERERRQTAEQRQRDLGWWCAPYYGAHNTALSRKNIEFLQLPEAKRRELLCEHPELRDYYQRLMEPYTARLRAKTKIVGLQCDGDHGFRFVAENEGKRTNYEVKLSSHGNYETVKTSPMKPEDSPAYVTWRQALENAKRMNRPMADSFQIHGQASDLVPGRFQFNFRDTNSGAQLTSVNLINAGFSPLSPRVVATIEAARLETIARSMAEAHPQAELPQMARNYQMFNLRADEAKSCCSERDAGKKQACMAELDQMRLTSPASLPRPASGPGAPGAGERTPAARPGRR